MLTRKQIIPLLIEASPSLLAVREEHVRYYEEEEILCNALGEFATHLFHQFQQNQTADFPAIGKVIERCLAEGDDDVDTVISFGLPEDIQNVWGNNDVDPELFVQYLLPKGLKRWQDVNAFWEGRSPNLPDIVRDMLQEYPGPSTLPSESEP